MRVDVGDGKGQHGERNTQIHGGLAEKIAGAGAENTFGHAATERAAETAATLGFLHEHETDQQKADDDEENNENGFEDNHGFFGVLRVLKLRA